MFIKLWDWDKKWQCTQVFEGHTHYVMHIVINPKDNNQFASASLDRTIKVSSASAYKASTCTCMNNDRINTVAFYSLTVHKVSTSGLDKVFYSVKVYKTLRNLQ